MSNNDNAYINAQQLVEQINAFMARCEKMLDDNIQPDMTGMDEQVEELSNNIHELKFDDLQAIQPLLQGLMDKLEILENQLKAQRDKVHSTLKGVTEKKQAVSAYQKMQSTTPIIPNPYPKGNTEDEA